MSVSAGKYTTNRNSGALVLFCIILISTIQSFSMTEICDIARARCFLTIKATCILSFSGVSSELKSGSV